MGELVTLGLGALAAYLGKDGIEKLLGPTAEYLGEGLRELTKKRIENIGHIMRRAQARLGDKVNQPGEVPPRVLNVVMNEGSFMSDTLATEYMGGVLASSRTESGRDDRGARIAKIIDSLSAYQLRTHYLVYGTIKTLFADKGLSVALEGRRRMRVFLPADGYVQAMEFSEKERKDIGPLLGHVFFGLHAESLIEQDFVFGEKEHLAKEFAAPRSGIICQPSGFGVELFLWAFGHGDQQNDFIFSKDFDHTSEGVLPSIPNAVPTRPQ